MRDDYSFIDKMDYISGYTPGWLKSAQKSAELRRTYNNSLPAEIALRESILKELFGRVGEKPMIIPPFYCDGEGRIKVGDNFFANYNFTVLDGGGVTIGDNVLIGPNVSIFAVGHPIHWKDRHPDQGYNLTVDPVTIGDNCWIGGGTIIQAGVNIGNGCVIGAGSVVTKDIPDEVIAVGTPCKVVRPLTEEDRVEYKKPDGLA